MLMNNEVALLENPNDNYEQLAALMGVQTGGQKDLLPRLSINRQALTADEKNIPPKTWTIEVDGQRVYGRPCQIRIFQNAFQYKHYDPDAEWKDESGQKHEGKYLNHTIIFTSWNEEQIDELGGIRCGKPKLTKEEYAALSKDEQKEIKKIKLYRLVYGQVRFDEAVNEDGEKVDVDWTPFLWQATGSNYGTLDPVVRQFEKKRVLPLLHPVTMDLERQQKGDNVWYTAVPVVDWTTRLEMNEDDLELFKKFRESIETYNGMIREKYNEVNGTAEEAAALGELGVDDDDVVDAEWEEDDS